MTIRPIQSFPPAQSDAAADASVRGDHTETRPESGVAVVVAQPVSGSLPKQNSSVAPRVPITYQLPQDVVEMHQDSEVKDQIIVDYLDQSKNLVLQVPSSEELSVERGIAQELQQAARSRATQGSPPAKGK